MRCAVVVCLLAMAMPACSRKQGAIDGIGEWHLGKTQKKEGYVCTPQPDGITFCSSQPQMTIAEQAADVLLYFAGDRDDSLLVEIILSINRCRPEGVALAFENQLGPPTEIAGTVRVWSGKAAMIIAQLPASDGRCEINFVDPRDQKRIGQIRGASGDATVRP
jgi:hypothetical protein